MNIYRAMFKGNHFDCPLYSALPKENIMETYICTCRLPENDRYAVRQHVHERKGVFKEMGTFALAGNAYSYKSTVENNYKIITVTPVPV